MVKKEQIKRDIKRNKPVRYDEMIRQSGTDRSIIRRPPYYLQQTPQSKSSYAYPFAIGDTVWGIYGGKVYPRKVTGFYICQHGEFAIVETCSGTCEVRIAIENIYLTQQAAMAAIKIGGK